MTFAAKYGPWALVTGAGRAEGLGFEFASQLAAEGVSAIADARTREHLPGRAPAPH